MLAVKKRSILSLMLSYKLGEREVVLSFSVRLGWRQLTGARGWSDIQHPSISWNTDHQVLFGLFFLNWHYFLIVRNLENSTTYEQRDYLAKSIWGHWICPEILPILSMIMLPIHNISKFSTVKKHQFKKKKKNQWKKFPLKNIAGSQAKRAKEASLFLRKLCM